jgi:hypothetical protein
MDDVIELKDIHGNMVKVTVTAAVQAVGDTLLDDESLFIGRTKQPAKDIKVCICEDSEVPG